MQPSPPFNFKWFLSSPKESPCSVAYAPHLPFPAQLLTTTNLLSISVLPVGPFHVNGLMQHVVCVWLLLHIVVFSSFIHVVAWMNLIFLLNNIPLYGYFTLYSTVHSWWTLRYLYFGAIEKMLLCYLFTCFYMDLCFHFSWVYTYERNYWVTLCLIFWGTTKLFFTVTAPFCTLTNVWRLWFLHFFTNTCF
jgi:hypothetical protein